MENSRNSMDSLPINDISPTVWFWPNSASQFIGGYNCAEQLCLNQSVCILVELVERIHAADDLRQYAHAGTIQMHA